MNDAQRSFLDRAAAEAPKATHPFPDMAACEAALESSWGHSQLAHEANNLFGMKQHIHAIYGTVNLPTREYLDAHWVQVMAPWVKYPDWASCFFDRLATLQRLSNVYPHYKAALDATSPLEYINQVSMTWSTDPQRAAHVTELFNDYHAAPAQQATT